jgi:PadR family transcriptional regulator, regulatory protein PadR
MLTLSAKESLILELLVSAGREDKMYGLQLVAASRRRLKRGTVYVTLGRMEEKGYIVSRAAETPAHGGLPRRLYQATPLGRQVLKRWANAVGAMLPEFA